MNKKKTARHFFNEGKESSFNLERLLAQLYSTCHDNPDLLKLFVDIQYRAAQVDGFHDKKIQALNTILQGIGFAPLNQQYRFYDDFFSHRPNQQEERQHSSSNQQRRTTSSVGTLSHAYALLEIDSTANKQEVKRAYRRLVSRNHPDKLIAQGLPEEMIKIANDKTQKIRKAYEQICTSKGW